TIIATNWCPISVAKMAMNPLTSAWDPLNSTDWDNESITGTTYLRIKKDLSSLIVTDPLPGIIAVPHESDITRIEALITGPFETPYCGGFFRFSIRCPPDYPIHPPRVKLLTTCNGTVRFNPNLYKNGKDVGRYVMPSPVWVLNSFNVVFVSTLGPSWSPALTLSTVLLSIQSLMNDKPYYNEPGYGKECPNVNPKDVETYNEIISHETIRVAVCDMIDNVNTDSHNCPDILRKNIRLSIERSFVEFYPHYEEVVQKNVFRSQRKMIDPFGGEERGVYDYNLLLKRLQNLKEKYEVSAQLSDADSESDMD
ncbi:unnamed protein product, partial [Medioppia subpectinata]